MYSPKIPERLISPLYQMARKRRQPMTRIVAEILPGNVAMRQICRRLGFTFEAETGATLLLR